MKKWFFLFVVLLLLGYGVFQQKAEVSLLYPSNKPNQAQEVSSQVKNQTIKVAKDQVYQGNLILVNKVYPLHQQGVKSDVIKLSQHKELVKGYGLYDNNIQLSKSVVQAFQKLVGAADKDKVRNFSITSGYRGLKEQEKLYEEMGSDYALPAGYSEHNLGLSLDIGSTLMEMNQAPEGKWLNQNAWKYGFILRYPKDQTAITGIQYEPWHYRYVGLPHSAIMQKQHLVLEQYLDYVKKEKSVTFQVDGEKYEISYYPVSNNTTIKVPANRRYEISGNNMDGVIVTVYP
ncbi:VanY-A/VanY-F/VanY-M family D-Ala-D-Ala carboxypeptidase [Paenibacillus sp. WQ 127069]|uniref:VanY-A/VanY-F/VanY-M family D-Ala-D-Ala carboxypeptidase n=1 Tax=Paenibacillus baimaensis TaxID=2982185 RepID=A0ABT2UBK3_9BACL|nr:VanY-A/VanY-F/VanY-M family D-Ala-D-Ala carboxypeptidase [Paenibacillus sp. WQ 127069]MCU6792003.1 VanY-A/VanY-F/VanY-M family D-Ala-D-Ala carboxypeptidase [Paenibacillus sp. WQ 127069]